MAKKITISNQKGGTAKTTSALNLGACLAEKGKQVLLVDFDPQANLTRGLGIILKDDEPGIDEFLKEECEHEEAIQNTEIEKLSIIPSRIDLAGVEENFLREPGREQQLRVVLGDIQDQYDYILIDPPPSLGRLMMNALTAADQVIIPVPAQIYAVEGLQLLLETIDSVRARVNPYLEDWAILHTLIDYRRKEDRLIMQMIKARYGAKVLNSAIRVNARIPEASRKGQAITQYAKNSVGEKEYSSCAEELLKIYEGVA
ncbi:ParA family protein [Desulforamulus ruminis]|uniref:Sporulation initiation inhibitor protein Soj n=1 Tax=Desulforamulus ruminis (strain ATCC 23193 / DSM 2154 / NCIMB 8452 / DL) TaxID=696281 RepID=F6DTY4_DESRL|nr:AAA family ATPase [Desulforamulus ruminis]AEG59002.1 cobyrinic acid a,c-diamide synthase [Desulforamulus ruminis DSM 2154]